jgi:hypothetical protein
MPNMYREPHSSSRSIGVALPCHTTMCAEYLPTGNGRYCSPSIFPSRVGMIYICTNRDATASVDARRGYVGDAAL